jgi:hypothetical protein
VTRTRLGQASGLRRTTLRDALGGELQAHEEAVRRVRVALQELRSQD